MIDRTELLDEVASDASVLDALPDADLDQLLSSLGIDVSAIVADTVERFVRAERERDALRRKHDN